MLRSMNRVVKQIFMTSSLILYEFENLQSEQDENVREFRINCKMYKKATFIFYVSQIKICRIFSVRRI